MSVTETRNGCPGHISVLMSSRKTSKRGISARVGVVMIDLLLLWTTCGYPGCSTIAMQGFSSCATKEFGRIMVYMS